jgi:tripeptidyl-peptidase-1
VRLYQVGDVNTASTGTFNTFLDALDESYCTYLGGDAAYLDAVYPDPGGDGYDGPCNAVAPLLAMFSRFLTFIEAALPESYQTRQCHEWMKLGLQGVSVVFASGDSGVANRYGIGLNSSCLTPPDEGPYIDENGIRFSPSFPSNYPWVTTGNVVQLLDCFQANNDKQVGATFLKGRNISDGEVVVALPYAPNPKRDYYSGAVSPMCSPSLLTKLTSCLTT